MFTNRDEFISAAAPFAKTYANKENAEIKNKAAKNAAFRAIVHLTFVAISDGVDVGPAFSTKKGARGKFAHIRNAKTYAETVRNYLTGGGIIRPTESQGAPVPYHIDSNGNELYTLSGMDGMSALYTADTSENHPNWRSLYREAKRNRDEESARLHEIHETRVQRVQAALDDGAENPRPGVSPSELLDAADGGALNAETSAAVRALESRGEEAMRRNTAERHERESVDSALNALLALTDVDKVQEVMNAAQRRAVELKMADDTADDDDNDDATDGTAAAAAA